MNFPLVLNSETILGILVIALSTLLLYFAVLHVLKAIKYKWFYYPAIISFLWFIVELVPLFMPGLDINGMTHNFTPGFLFAGALIEGLTLFYPLLIIYNGHFGKNTLIYYFGFIAVYAILYPIWSVFSNPDGVVYYTIAEMFNSGAYVEFMFRFILLLYTCVHMFYTVHMINSFVDVYDKYLDETYSDTENFNLRWLRMFKYPIYVMAVFFVSYVLLDIILLNIIYVIFLMFVLSAFLYFSLDLEYSDFYDNYKVTWSFRKNAWIKEPIKQIESDIIEETEAQELLTDIIVQRYTKIIDDWMREEKPYIRPDFRVAGVYTKLGIDRLSCNEFFAKAYGAYFRSWVMKYRIEEAVRLIKENPNKPIKEVAYESGFSSPSVFARSFATVMGMSCTRYRDTVLKFD